MRLFLSYSRRDAAYAERLRAGLEGAGHDVWIDRDDLVVGERWRTSIVEGITSADAVVLVVSPPSMASEHVLREVSLAAESDKPLYPVRLVPCEVPASFRYLLAGIQFVDVARAGEPAALAQLLAGLAGAPPVAPAGVGAAPPSPPVPAVAASRGPSRRGVIGAGAAVAAVTAVGFALIRRGGGGGGRGAAVEPDVLDATTAPRAEPVGTTVGAVAGETVEYAERLGWFGDEYLLFGIQLRSATLRPVPGVADRLDLRVEALAGNPSTKNQNLVELPAPAVVAGGRQVSTFLDYSGEVPGAGTSLFAITATVPTSFTLAASALVFGNDASNRTVIPLDGTSPIETAQPARGFADGAVTDGGLTQVRVVESLAWPNYGPGRRGEAWIELGVEATYAGQPVPGDYETLAWALQRPDGSVAGADLSFVFPQGVNGIVEPGRRVRSGLRFAVAQPPSGVYTLVTSSRQAALGNPGTRDATLSFTVP